MEYARRRMSARKQRRVLIPFFGAGLVASIFFVVKLLFERDSGFGGGLIQDEKFILGFAFAILAFMSIGVGAAMFATLLSGQRRIEDDALELLLRKVEKESANHTSEGIRRPADGSPKPSM